MRQKRFTSLHLISAVLFGALAALLLGTLSIWIFLGPQTLSLLEGMALIRARFVGPYDPTAVVDQAFYGMVEGLDDRWSHYLSAEEFQAQTQRRTNTYVGVGVTVVYTDERGLLIEAVKSGSPAEAAGVSIGEIITAVDGVSIAGDQRQTGTTKIMGENGTQVTLTLLSPDGTSRDVAMIRAAVETEPVHSEVLESNVGYIKLENFYSHSAEKFCAAVNDLSQKNVSAFVFDMRNNGGGYVDELTQMLDRLLPEGIIFRTQDKDGNEKTVESDATCITVPMAVLVNADTYSAAEIFAAELQEAAGAKIIGVETSGKGYSQQTFALPHGGALSISTARYTTGNGVSLIGTGVTLDAECPLEEDKAALLWAGTLSLEEDTQLGKALELLQPA